MRLLLIFFFLPSFVFAIDEFEKDLANLKQKYKGEYKKEEQIKWDQMVEKESKPSFSESFHEKFRHLDFNVFFNYYYFFTNFDPDGEISGQLSSAGPDIDILYKAWKYFDIYLYGNYGITGNASFVETTNIYDVPNNYLVGLGVYYTNKIPNFSAYVTFEYQETSYVGVNDKLDYSMINVLTQLQAEQVDSINMVLGLDIPFRVMDKNGFVRILAAPSLLAKSTLQDESYTENLSQLQLGLKLKYLFHEPYSLDLGWRGGFNQGVTTMTFNNYYINFGFRF